MSCHVTYNDYHESSSQSSLVCFEIALVSPCTRSGYSGDRCEQIDRCAFGSNPCQNGATCINTRDGGFFCRCLPGYSGDTCQVKQILTLFHN